MSLQYPITFALFFKILVKSLWACVVAKVVWSTIVIDIFEHNLMRIMNFLW